MRRFAEVAFQETLRLSKEHALQQGYSAQVE